MYRMYLLERNCTVKLRKEHQVKITMKEGPFYDRITIMVDGKVAFTRKIMLRLKGKSSFKLDGVDVTVRWRVKLDFPGTLPDYAVLEYKGHLLAEANGKRDMLRGGKQNNDNEDVPKWAWVFMGACALIPIVSLGGAIPFVAGGFGFLTCRDISKNLSRPTSINVILCAGVTVAMWVAVIAVVGGLAILMN